MTKMFTDIKWGARQRLQHIEAMSYYTGVITRSDLAKAFGISDAAATKDLKLYNELAPDNLIYRHNVFGFVPSPGFQPQFSDLEPAAILPMIAANLATANGPYGEQALYGIATESLPLPARLPKREVLAQVLRAIKQGRKLQVSYHSLSERDGEQERLLEPHALVNTGLRWHLRAYNEETYDFRDFVLSRFTAALMLPEAAESSAQYDDDWSEIVTLQLSPHPKLDAQKRARLLIDYHHENGQIEIPVRRALIAYVLQRLAVDTSADHSMNPNAHQLIILNRDEIEPFAGWAFG
ncbi:MAG: WYL domain-containing protein [Ectothiorhodospiraceae bacterium]|nr:WYL domain-containing protein [Ectothiorhodospiraceae bacterium]